MISKLRFSLALLLALLIGSIDASAAFVGGRTDFRDEAIYFVITTRFYDGDNSNNTYCWDGSKDAANQDPEWRGDFKGLIEKLDYIKALGFTAIWITPIVQNASGFDYHGYHAMDFSSVDKRYESNDCKFQDLIDAAHAKGMKIILDIVINHTGNFGEEHLCKLFNRDWTKPQSDIDQCMVPFTIKDGGKLKDNYLDLPGGEQYGDRLSKMKNTDGKNNDNHNLWHHYGNFNWDEPNRWWAQIAGDCVDLNTENPQTYKYLIDCYGTFIKMGVDGFRIDTGGHISRLTFNKVFVPAFKALGEQYKSKRLNQCPFYMYAEVCARFQGSVTYRGQPSLSPYFYTWQSDASLLNQWNDNESYWNNIAIYESTDPATLDNQKLCLTEHNNNKNESSQPKSTNALLQGNNYHAPDYSKASGLNVIDFPVHYSFNSVGDVWGLFRSDNFYNDASFNVVYVDSHDYCPGSNDGTRFNRGTDQWAENLSLMFTFRGIPCLYYGSEIEFQKGKTIDEGPNLALKNSGRAYFGGYIKGNVTVSDFAKVTNATGNVAATLSHPLVKHLQRLNLIRQAVPALRKGQYSFDGCSAQGGYAFKRRYTAGGVDSYVLVTLNSAATFTGVLNGTYVDAITGDKKTVTNGTLTTTSCSGKGNMRIYVLNGTGKIGEDGPYLYTNSPVRPSILSYDGTQDEGDPNTQYITGGGGGGSVEPEVPITPSMSEGEQAIFFERPDSYGTAIRAWIWNGDENYTGGSWPGQSLEYLGNKIYKWVYTGNKKVAGKVIFNDGSQQTSSEGWDYVNGGYYTINGYQRTIEGAGEIPDVPEPTPETNSDWTVYFDKPSNWGDAYAYVYHRDNGSVVELAPWHGTRMTLQSGSRYMLHFTMPIANGWILFNDGGSQQTAGDPGFILYNNGIYDVNGVVDSGVSSISTDAASLKVYGSAGVLYIVAQQRQRVQIVGLDGRAIFIEVDEGVNAINSLPRGFYVVGGHKVIL